MKNSIALELILELLDSVEEINNLISREDRQMAVVHYNSLEKRMITITSSLPKGHIVKRVLHKINTLHLPNFYLELESDIEKFEKEGFQFEVEDQK